MWQEIKNELKAEWRKFASDREMWVWFAVALVVVVGGTAVIAWQTPGALGTLAWSAAFSAWIVALNVRMAKRDRLTEEGVTSMKVEAVARVVFDQEASESDVRLGVRWYRLFVGGHDIGRILYQPCAHRTHAWEAHYPPAAVPSQGAFRSQRRAVQALVSRSFY